jgi:hypothetical protein
MNWLSWTLMALAFVDPKIKATADELKLVELVRGIRSADYRGQRDELKRLDAGLDQVKSTKLGAYREYWRGFARWRRAINGFNETPLPHDVKADLEGGIASFRAALVQEPDWIEAKLGVAGCAASLFYLAAGDKPKLDALLAEYLPVWQELRDKGQSNPRVLWLIGGSQLSAPPPVGGDPVKAAATYRRGLEAARAEALRPEKPPEWVPTWGAPEHLMSLAYVYSTGALADRDVAQGYVDGTLAMVPDWHYVKDVLAPKVQALPPRAR